MRTIRIMGFPVPSNNLIQTACAEASWKWEVLIRWIFGNVSKLVVEGGASRRAAARILQASR